MARRKNTKFIDPRYFMDEKQERLDEVRADAYTKFTNNVWFIDGERANLMVPKNVQKLIIAQKPFQVFLQHASGQNAQLEGGTFVQVTSEILKKAGMDTSMGVDMRALGKVLVALVNPRVPKDERGTVKQVRQTQRR
jgi:hypothetical protein